MPTTKKKYGRPPADVDARRRDSRTNDRDLSFRSSDRTPPLTALVDHFFNNQRDGARAKQPETRLELPASSTAFNIQRNNTKKEISDYQIFPSFSSFPPELTKNGLSHSMTLRNSKIQDDPLSYCGVTGVWNVCVCVSSHEIIWWWW